MNSLYDYLRGFYDVLLMASFVPFLVYFMLSWRDHVRRSFLQVFEGPQRMIVGNKNSQRSHSPPCDLRIVRCLGKNYQVYGTEPSFENRTFVRPEREDQPRRP